MAKANNMCSSSSSSSSSISSGCSSSGVRKRSFFIQDLLEIGSDKASSKLIPASMTIAEDDENEVNVTSRSRSGSRSRSRSGSPCSSVASENSSSCSNNLSKKSRKSRTAFSDYQLNSLERSFEKHKYLSVQDRVELAARLNLTDTQVDRIFSYF